MSIINANLNQSKLIIFAGAGLSAESGLQTFRDNNGLWHKYNVHDICDIRTYHKNREIVLDFYNKRKMDIKNAEPNDAHKYIAHIQKAFGTHRVQVLTTNVDNLLTRAGVDDVIHLHGSIENTLCLSCGYEWYSYDHDYNMNETCPECSSLNTKPGVVFFFENAPQYSNMKTILSLSGSRVLNNILIIGTSFQVIDLSRIMVGRYHPSFNKLFLIDKNPDFSKSGYFEKIYPNLASVGLKKFIELDIPNLMTNH